LGTRRCAAGLDAETDDLRRLDGGTEDGSALELASLNPAQPAREIAVTDRTDAWDIR
jgi:hypothetical protein